MRDGPVGESESLRVCPLLKQPYFRLYTLVIKFGARQSRTFDIERHGMPQSDFGEPVCVIDLAVASAPRQLSERGCLPLRDIGEVRAEIIGEVRA